MHRGAWWQVVIRGSHVGSALRERHAAAPSCVFPENEILQHRKARSTRTVQYSTVAISSAFSQNVMPTRRDMRSPTRAILVRILRERGAAAFQSAFCDNAIQWLSPARSLRTQISDIPRREERFSRMRCGTTLVRVLRERTGRPTDPRGAFPETRCVTSFVRVLWERRSTTPQFAKSVPRERGAVRPPAVLRIAFSENAVHR